MTAVDLFGTTHQIREQVFSALPEWQKKQVRSRTDLTLDRGMCLITVPNPGQDPEVTKVMCNQCCNQFAD